MKIVILTFFLTMLSLTNIKTVEGDSSIIPYYMYNASTTFNIDTGLLYAICTVESKCRSNAINKNDATKERKALGIIEHSLGMFQLKLATARTLGFKGSSKELLKPEVNTYYAAKLLRSLYTRYGINTIKVISAYNAGKYTKTNKEYVHKVLEIYARYKLDRRF